uniref:Uncharacterized protein LOC111108695 n=1 Tax=Crassostrea virginica TaxID=6565 RepID=A0A8B8BAL9_CRAVI|nr:uncharacterized protein LOC111108695 [Crassostrea virginica]
MSHSCGQSSFEDGECGGQNHFSAYEAYTNSYHSKTSKTDTSNTTCVIIGVALVIFTVSSVFFVVWYCRSRRRNKRKPREPIGSQHDSETIAATRMMKLCLVLEDIMKYYAKTRLRICMIFHNMTGDIKKQRI